MYTKLTNSDKSTDYIILNAIIVFEKYNSIFKNFRVMSKIKSVRVQIKTPYQLN